MQHAPRACLRHAQAPAAERRAWQAHGRAHGAGAGSLRITRAASSRGRHAGRGQCSWGPTGWLPPPRVSWRRFSEAGACGDVLSECGGQPGAQELPADRGGGEGESVSARSSAGRAACRPAGPGLRYTCCPRAGVPCQLCMPGLLQTPLLPPPFPHLTSWCASRASRWPPRAAAQRPAGRRWWRRGAGSAGRRGADQPPHTSWKASRG